MKRRKIYDRCLLVPTSQRKNMLTRLSTIAPQNAALKLSTWNPGTIADASSSMRALTIKYSRIMIDIRRGPIIVNSGPGKGTTAAARGTALRAVGQGMRVLMLQFLKGSWHYGELDAVQAFGDKFVMTQMGRCFVKVGTEKPDPEDVRMVEQAWADSEQAIQSGQWDLIILDEINYAISYGMLDPAKVAEGLKKKPEMVHVILTGRNAHPTLVELADTVTEMRQVKQAYEKGVMAQRGIEY